MSKIKVNEIEAATGSTVTIPTGQTFTVTDGIPATNLSGTIADARLPTIPEAKLPTIPVAKGGTGLTSLGSAGQAIKVNSGGNALEFGAVAGGKVLQVIQAVKSSEGSTTSTSYVATGLELQITPSATSSKVLIMSNNPAYVNSGSQWYYNTIYRDSTNLTTGGDSFAGLRNNSNATGASMVCNFLDSPNSTSQLTYKLMHKVSNSGTTGYVSINNWNSTIIAIEIGA